MAELNTSLEIKIKDGYNPNQIVALLKATGARVDNVSDKTIYATTNPFLVNHIKSNDAVESVTNKTAPTTPAKIPNVMPSPGGTADPQSHSAAIPQMTPPHTDHTNPPEKKWFGK
jgi:hypothetical protein